MNNEPIALQLADALLRNNQQSINIEAAAELRMQNNALINADDTRNRLIRRVTELEARIAELEAQLEAIGAGGVEPLRKRECLHQISPEHSILGIFLSAMSDQLKIDGPAMRDAMLWYCGVQEIATEPQPAAQALDALKKAGSIAVSAVKTNSRDIADWRDDMDRIAAIAGQQGARNG